MQHIVAARNDTLASAVDAAQQNIRTNRHILQGNTGEMVRRNTELKRFCAVQLMQVSTLEPIEFCMARVYWLISSAVVWLGANHLAIGMLAMTSSKFTRLTLVNSFARE